MGTAEIATVAGVIGTAIGTIIGVASANWINIRKQKTVERKQEHDLEMASQELFYNQLRDRLDSLEKQKQEERNQYREDVAKLQDAHKKEFAQLRAEHLDCVAGQAEMKGENGRLKAEQDRLNERMDKERDEMQKWIRHEIVNVVNIEVVKLSAELIKFKNEMMQTISVALSSSLSPATPPPAEP